MQNVPHFPEFRRFTYDDQEWYDDFYRHFSPCADFSFGNLIVWLDWHEDLMVSQLNGNLVLRCTTIFMHDKEIFTLLGKNQLKQTVDTVFSYRAATGDEAVLFGLTDDVVERLRSQSDYTIIDDEDNKEYLYPASNWAGLDGSLMRKLRREVVTYTKNVGEETDMKLIDLRDPAHIAIIQDSLAKWSRVYSNNDLEREEAKVLDRLFSLAHHLPHQCLGLYINGSLEAFLIYQPLPQHSTAIFNHVKASYNYKYMFDYLLHRAAQHVVDLGVTQINFEQDLGITGLREHKNSLKPQGFIKKYTVRLATQNP